MRLEAYLSEGRTNKIDPSYAIEYIRKHCMKSATTWAKNDSALYRGHVYVGSDYGLVSPKKHKRASANTSNEYTLLIDNSPKWKAYPNRAKSLICGNTESAAYGVTSEKYLVLPVDGSKIGVCPEDDFWDSFGNTYEGQMNDFNDELRRMYDYMFGKTPAQSSYAALKKQIDKMDKRLAEDDSILHGDLRWMTIPTMARSEGMTLWQVINYILDPNENKFTLMKAGDILPSDRRECWTDGDSVLIRVPYLQYNQDDIKKLIMQ